MSHPQKGHGRKRPKRFHHGRAEGRLAAPKLDAIAAAESRGRSADDELRSVAARYHEEIDLWAGFAAAAPFVPQLEVVL